jgi:transcriptional regulator with XRE-family HTH domain
MFDIDTLAIDESIKPTLLGVTLRRLRLQREWSMGQLAEVSGVDKSIISRLESGATRAAHPSNIEAFAKTFGVPVETLRRLSQLSRKPILDIEDKITVVLPTAQPENAAHAAALPNASDFLDIETIKGLAERLTSTKCDPATYQTVEQTARQLVKFLSEQTGAYPHPGKWTEVRKLIESSSYDDR